MQIIQNTRMLIGPGLRQRQQLTSVNNQLQLFTKLKKNKQLQQANYKEAENYESSFCSHAFQQRSKNNSRSSFSSLELDSFNNPQYGLEQNDQHLMGLTPDQINQLERLKNDKIGFVVEASLKSGRPVRQIMQQYVMSQLEMQVWFIYVTGKRQDNAKQKRQYPKKYNEIKQPLYNLESQYCLLNQDQVWNKNLQSTAQYTEDSPARHIEKTTNLPNSNAINDNSNDIQNKLCFNRSKIKSGRRKDKSQSTIKNLQSPNPRSFSDDHNSNVLIQDYSKNKQQINIVQFTLGNVHDDNQHQPQYHGEHYDCDNQNFTERQAESIRVNNLKQENKILDQISSNEKVVSFNKRRKLPKGKAIKFRVMGNINHEST